MKTIIKLILVIAWMLLIFSFSNQKAADSSKLSDGFIVKTVSVFKGESLSKESGELITKKYTKVVRKLAHFTIYLVLGVLVINLIVDLNIKNVILISLLVCFLYSATDEFHQLFISGRSGEGLDVIIDTTGSFFGIISYFLLKKSLKKVK